MKLCQDTTLLLPQTTLSHGDQTLSICEALGFSTWLKKDPLPLFPAALSACRTIWFGVGALWSFE